MVIKNVVGKEILTNLENCFNSSEEKIDQGPINGSIGYFNLDCTQKLLFDFKKIIEDTINVEVKPETTFMRKMFKGHFLQPHIDKDHMNVTVSLLVNKSDDNFKNPLILHTNPHQYFYTDIGDCVIMKDSHALKHSRPPLESDWMLLIFLHYSYIRNIERKNTVI
jgi:hypothetical protein